MIAHMDNPNLAILEMAVLALGDLTDSLVFVGGCATGLLVTRMRANQIRATEDVDVIAQVATIAEYHDFESMLTSRGFRHDTSPDAPICRWLSGGFTLDLMPSQPGVLSFHNRWYPLAVSTANPATLPSGRSIKLIAAPVFVATKLEAFKGRGNGDFLVSHDLEDIVTVVDGRPTLIEELRGAPRSAPHLHRHGDCVAPERTTICRCRSGPSSRRRREPVSGTHRDRSLGSTDAGRARTDAGIAASSR